MVSESKPIDMDEYLRRNKLLAAAEGAKAGASVSLKRLEMQKRPPKWLVASLRGIVDRADRVVQEMVRHRDEVKP